MGALVVVLVVGLALALSARARDLARIFVVSGWRVPVGGTTSTGGPMRALGTDSVSRAAAETPPPTLHWVPPSDATWQWLPAGQLDFSHPADVYELPLATTSPDVPAEIHARGSHAVCWLPVSTVSTSDPNAKDLDPTLLGRDVPGHPGARYLDIRRLDDLKPFFSARLDDCWAKGFDGVDVSGIDAYDTASEPGTGFPVGITDAVALATTVAGLGHGRGLAVGFHGALVTAPRDRLVDAVEPITDFAVAERCARSTFGCGVFARYPQRGKAVLHLEYLQDYANGTPANARAILHLMCKAVAPYGYSSILKDGGGTNPAWRLACP